jgi:aspartate/methionine/tyrosine aminotransferase
VRNLTELEQQAVDAPMNLSDGHPRFRLTDTQQMIVQRLPELFDDARRERFDNLERRAQRCFLSAIGQHRAPVAEGRVRSVYSSSVGTMVVGRVLRRSFPRVAVIHPTFDNIPDLLREHADLVPISERELMEADLAGAVGQGATAVWVTTPNNPTGWVLDRGHFGALAQEAARRRLLLCLDTSFRGFDVRAQHDSYEILESVGGDYIVIEDTGKLWPVGELKAGFIASSRSLNDEVARALSDVLLTVSPVILRLIEELAQDASAGGFNALHDLIARNRERAITAARGLEIMTVDGQDARISVSMLRFRSPAAAQYVYSGLHRTGVYLLPCQQFYWAQPREGELCLRIALARDHEFFDEGLRRLEQVTLDVPSANGAVAVTPPAPVADRAQGLCPSPGPGRGSDSAQCGCDRSGTWAARCVAAAGRDVPVSAGSSVRTAWD